MRPIKLVFADALTLFCESLAALLQAERSIQLCAVVYSSEDLLHQVESHLPDVVLIGLQLPGGSAAGVTRSLKERYPWIAILVTSPIDDDDRICELAAAGADGYLSKGTSTSKDLVKALHTVYRGEPYFNGRIFLRVSRMVATQKHPLIPAPSLSEKEIEIIRLICEQYSSKQIAPLVGLTDRTVQFYRRAIMEKIGAQNVVGIVMYAIRNGIHRVEQLRS